ncbi:MULTISPECIES: trp operon repressor [Cysteiniphilum]|nr:MULTISPECIES: trp operon repressor [Cysteiniphilum]
MESNWKNLVKLLQQTNDETEMTKLLDFLFTLEEKNQISNRYALAELMILGEKPQREIAKNLGVSISTVTRCSNALKVLPDEIKQKFIQPQSKKANT